LELVLNLSSVNRLMAVANTRFTEPVLKFIEEFNDLKLITKLHFVWEHVNIIID